MIIVVALFIVVLVGGVFLYNSYQTAQQAAQDQQNITQGKGRLVLAITDAALSLQGLTSVFIDIDKAEVHNSMGAWVLTSNAHRRFDLLDLKNTSVVSLLSNTQVDVENYDQARLTVSKVIVVENGVEKEAKLPSGELKIPLNIQVNAGKISTVILDFMVDKSLHVTGNGKIIFSPVIKVKKSEDAAVETQAGNKLVISNGKQKVDEDFGMDEKGAIKNNFVLTGDLDIDANNAIIVKGGQQKTVTLNLTAQNNSGITGTAQLSEVNGRVKIVLMAPSSLLGANRPPEPAHIHAGSCPNPLAIKYPLNSAVNGKSETTINVSLADLKAQFPLAINMHKSSAQMSVYIACTNVVF